MISLILIIIAMIVIVAAVAMLVEVMGFLVNVGLWLFIAIDFIAIGIWLIRKIAKK